MVQYLFWVFFPMKYYWTTGVFLSQVMNSSLVSFKDFSLITFQLNLLRLDYLYILRTFHLWVFFLSFSLYFDFVYKMVENQLSVQKLVIQNSTNQFQHLWSIFLRKFQAAGTKAFLLFSLNFTFYWICSSLSRNRWVLCSLVYR